MSTLASSAAAVTMSPLTLAVQPSGNVIAATGLSSGILTVSAKTGVAIETASNRQTTKYFMLVVGLPIPELIAIRFANAEELDALRRAVQNQGMKPLSNVFWGSDQ
jgi:hypothetical protein